jgi:hypothetical protein
MRMFAPGWQGEALADGYMARRADRLTDYQLRHGCLAELTAADSGELWLLCDAHNRLAERVALAETTRRRA